MHRFCDEAHKDSGVHLHISMLSEVPSAHKEQSGEVNANGVKGWSWRRTCDWEETHLLVDGFDIDSSTECARTAEKLDMIPNSRYVVRLGEHGEQDRHSRM